MLAYQFLRVVLHLFAGLWTCGVIFPKADHAARQAHIQRWSARLVALCGVKIEVLHGNQKQLSERALVVSNHINWLDIFVINSMQPCRFVAKSDIRDWPVLGWLCDRAGTVFIARGRMRDVRKTYEGLVTRLQAGEHVAFFPEGTTAAQGSLLPFHANLFEAAIEAKVAVQPYALRYVDAQGNTHTAANFVGGMTFVQSMVTIFKAKNLTAQLIVLPRLATDEASHRRELADTAHHFIAQSLAQTIL